MTVLTFLLPTYSVLGLAFPATAQDAASAPPVRVQYPPLLPQRQSPIDQKSIDLAGGLSLFLPGVGSFYADHSGHGIRHAVIGGIALFGIVAGVTSACQNNIVCDGHERGYELAIISSIAFGVNAFWGAATAVSDARRFNVAQGAHPPGRSSRAYQVNPGWGAALKGLWLGMHVRF